MLEASLGANQSKSCGRVVWELKAHSVTWFAVALLLVQNNVCVCYSIRAFFQIVSALREQPDTSQT